MLVAELQRLIADAGSSDNAGWPYEEGGVTYWDELGDITPDEDTVSAIKSGVNLPGDTVDYHSEIFNAKDFHGNVRDCELRWNVKDKATPCIENENEDPPTVSFIFILLPISIS